MQSMIMMDDAIEFEVATIEAAQEGWRVVPGTQGFASGTVRGMRYPGEEILKSYYWVWMEKEDDVEEVQF